MKKSLLTVILLSAAIVSPAKPKKDKAELSKLFDTARYIYVEEFDGDRQSPDLLALDRQAIANIQGQLHDWGRYSLTTSRDQAELVLVVHRSRRDRSDSGPIAGASGPPIVYGSPRPAGKSPFPGGSGSNDPSSTAGADRSGANDEEITAPDDQLSVYMINGSGSLTGPLWTQSKRNGLNSPQVPLFAKLKTDVETAYPK